MQLAMRFGEIRAIRRAAAGSLIARSALHKAAAMASTVAIARAPLAARFISSW
ncbi:MAG: hypothetical protein M1457_10285 [bacterium]|nr:hypothetical protein [bacterium]